jgi:uroporphyrin-III C-methyltransferase/precorrin-2 dehydrogenase/sirohydrochlorin ferrochelatase
MCSEKRTMRRETILMPDISGKLNGPHTAEHRLNGRTTLRGPAVMRYFPLFADLRGRTVLVVGGGEEALRKVRLIRKTEARIAVAATELHPELADLAAMGGIAWDARPFAAGMVEGAALVFACEAATREAVSAAALAANVPVNAVDRADLSTVIVPAIVDRDPIVVAIGSEGAAPILAQHIRAAVEAMLPPAIGGLAAAAEALRARVAEAIAAGAPRRAFWRQFFFGRPRTLFLEGRTDAFAASVEALIASRAAAPQQGAVAFVAAGPGDPELLTLKAQRKLQEADVIVADRAIPAAILEYARRDAVRVFVETPGEAREAVLREAAAGRQVVRLSAALASDPALRVALDQTGAAIEIVPGVGFPAEVASFTLERRAGGRR